MPDQPRFAPDCCLFAGVALIDSVRQNNPSGPPLNTREDLEIRSRVTR
jgi:hypothetical protein